MVRGLLEGQGVTGRPGGYNLHVLDGSVRQLRVCNNPLSEREVFMTGTLII